MEVGEKVEDDEIVAEEQGREDGPSGLTVASPRPPPARNRKP